MSEIAVVFGDSVELSGIVTAPKGEARRAGAILLSAGIRHRVGPNRMHVTLARALAANGLPSLRFDLSGIGESGTRTEDVAFGDRVVDEAQAAMEVLSAAHGVERFVLYGLCSGADNALRVAVADPRVTGAVLLQAYSFGSPAYRLAKTARALFKPANWRRLARGQLPAPHIWKRVRETLPARSGRDSGESGDPATAWHMPPRERILGDLRTLIGRGTRLLFVYSRPSAAEFNYRRIIRPELRKHRQGRVAQVEMFVRSDHNITPLAHQARLVDLVVSWARDVVDAER